MTDPDNTTDPTATRFIASIDARLLYWTRLPVEAGVLDVQQSRYRFERVLPVPVEGLHIVRARLDDGGTLLVGIEAERLRAHLAGRQDVSADTWALLPDRLPEHLPPGEAGALAGLNLLQGPFEPERRRQARRLRGTALGVGMAVALSLALVGIESRVATQDRAADAMQRSAQEVLAQGLGPTSSPLPPAAQLTQELRRLEQAARSSAAAPLDTAGVLQHLWAAWPNDVRTQIETISLAADRLVMRGSVPTLADAERIAKACPTITAGDTVFQAAPLQAEQTARGAVFLLTWYEQAGRTGGAP